MRLTSSAPGGVVSRPADVRLGDAPGAVAASAGIRHQVLLLGKGGWYWTAPRNKIGGYSEQ